MKWWQRKSESEADASQDKKEDAKHPDPLYATRDELTQMRREITEGLTWIKDKVIPRNDDPQDDTSTRLPEVKDVSDDQYQAALDNLQNPDFDGDRRAQLRTLQVREEANRERLRRDVLSETRREIQSILPQVHSLNEEITRTSLQALPYYTLFKKDIDDALTKVPMGQRNIQMATLIHNQLVGNNTQAVVDFEIAERARKAAEHDAALAPPGRSRTPGTRDAKPDFASTFGDRFSDPKERIHGAPLWNERSPHHRDPDSFARSRGFDDANDYAEFTHAMMAIEPCPNCFMEPGRDGKCQCDNIAQFNGRRADTLF